MKSLHADKDKDDLEKVYTKKLSDLSKKAFQEKKDLEHRCINLSKQVSKFEKILITERDTFVKERKVLEDKIIELPKQISTLQDLFEKERQIFQEKKKFFDFEKKVFEKKNVGIFKKIPEKNKNLEKDFEQERQIFKSEISRLTAKLLVLSSDILKEQKVRSDFQKKIDTILEEKNVLTENIKQLEAVNVELSDKISADVINQSPYDNSTESVCSFKTASTCHYDKSLEKNVYKKGQMVWRVNVSPDEKKNDKSSASTSKAKKNNAHKGTTVPTSRKPKVALSEEHDASFYEFSLRAHQRQR
ncbi:hypothetical protein L6452_28035 [Arctium lappa]|uniref:Uncharacterized protein n=1 Tax=Arctium lappa TaxID=4217 RepID=A0ACB8ZWT1_ARCLA|nr:hypothetical protein L6452_28035 [Arctium lappa]